MQTAFHMGQLVRPKRSPSGRTDGRAYCIVGILAAPDGIEQPCAFRMAEPPE